MVTQGVYQRSLCNTISTVSCKNHFLYELRMTNADRSRAHHPSQNKWSFCARPNAHHFHQIPHSQCGATGQHFHLTWVYVIKYVQAETVPLCYFQQQSAIQYLQFSLSEQPATSPQELLLTKQCHMIKHLPSFPNTSLDRQTVLKLLSFLQGFNFTTSMMQPSATLHRVLLTSTLNSGRVEDDKHHAPPVWPGFDWQMQTTAENASPYLDLDHIH